MPKMPEHIQTAIQAYKDFLLKQYKLEYPESYERSSKQSQLAIQTVREFLNKKQEFTITDIVEKCGCSRETVTFAVKAWGNKVVKTQKVVDGRKINFWTAT